MASTQSEGIDVALEALYIVLPYVFPVRSAEYLTGTEGALFCQAGLSQQSQFPPIGNALHLPSWFCPQVNDTNSLCEWIIAQMNKGITVGLGEVWVGRSVYTGWCYVPFVPAIVNEYGSDGHAEIDAARD